MTGMLYETLHLTGHIILIFDLFRKGSNKISTPLDMEWVYIWKKWVMLNMIKEISYMVDNRNQYLYAELNPVPYTGYKV